MDSGQPSVQHMDRLDTGHLLLLLLLLKLFLLLGFGPCTDSTPLHTVYGTEVPCGGGALRPQ